MGQNLQPIVAELKSLECGSLFNLKGFGERLLSFFVICGVYDKPARAAVLNIKSVNCYFGCLKCVQEGTQLQSSKGTPFETLFEILIYCIIYRWQTDCLSAQRKQRRGIPGYRRGRK